MKYSPPLDRNGQLVSTGDVLAPIGWGCCVTMTLCNERATVVGWKPRGKAIVQFTGDIGTREVHTQCFRKVPA